MSEQDRATVILERMQALAVLLQESGSITGNQAGDLLETLIAGSRAEMSELVAAIRKPAGPR